MNKNEIDLVDLKINEDEINNLSFDKDPLINNSLKLYIKDLGNKPLLTKEEEIDLVKRIQKGDLNARKELVFRNARLVIWRAKKYIGKGLAFADLIDEGNLGLIKASMKYDLSFENRFSTYAVYWIEQSIRRAISEKGRTIRLPFNVHDDLNKISRVEAKLVLKLNREPTFEEIAKELNYSISIEKIKKLKLFTSDSISLDAPLNDDKDFQLKDLIENESYISPKKHIETNLQNETLHKALSTLSFREQYVIRLRFGLTDGKYYTLEEIANLLNISRERVRQIQAKALHHLKALPDNFE